MEGTMDMTSNASKSSAAASAPHNHQQEEAVVVSSPLEKEHAARNKRLVHHHQEGTGGSGEPKPRTQRQQEAGINCPRCPSKNTKFCYYNNYNLNQPRYFCKECRRYFTLGGNLRCVPMGGCRRNKRTSGSSSSSAASKTAATAAEVVNTAVTTLVLTTASTMSMPCSPMTGLIRNNTLLTLTPTGGSHGLSVAMGEQQGILPFSPLSLSGNQAPELAPGGSGTGFLPLVAPLSLSDDQAPEELALEGSDDMTPTFLDMLIGGYFGDGSSSNSYGAGLDMGGGSNGMDMSFLLPEIGASVADPMQTMLVDGMNHVAGELQWVPSEIDSYINYDVADAGVEQQQEEEAKDTTNSDGAQG